MGKGPLCYVVLARAIVIYDFRGPKSNPRFWKNLRRLFSLAGDGSMVQYSVFVTRKKRGAVAAVKVAKHYGAHARRLGILTITCEN